MPYGKTFIMREQIHCGQRCEQSVKNFLITFGLKNRYSQLISYYKKVGESQQLSRKSYQLITHTFPNTLTHYHQLSKSYPQDTIQRYSHRCFFSEHYRGKGVWVKCEQIVEIGAKQIHRIGHSFVTSPQLLLYSHNPQALSYSITI